MLLGTDGWAGPGVAGGDVLQVQDWVPADDAAWLAHHLELAGYQHGRWISSLLI